MGINNKINVIMNDSHKWNHYKLSGRSVWYIGNKQAVDEIVTAMEFSAELMQSMGAILALRHEFYSAIVEENGAVFAFTDVSRSYPIFYSEDRGSFIISNDSRKVLDTISSKDVNEENVLEFLTVGYVTGNQTIYKKLHQLCVGEMLYMNDNMNSPLLKRYFNYHDSHKKEKYSEGSLIKSLGDTIDASINRLIELVDNSPIVVPISGGLDSRLILAKLVEKNYKNLSSFSYGPKGNSDAKIGRDVAKQLGVPWTFISIDTREVREFYNSEVRKNYSRFSDGLFTIPNYQDLLPLIKLRELGLIDRNSYVVNGQSGDFNSGGHIPDILMRTDAKWEDLINALINKHYSLWKNLLDKENYKLFSNRVNRIISTFEFSNNKEEFNHEDLVNLYERWEYEERQTKYILNGQRIYDYLDLKWHLPLWDGEFVRFWCEVPVEFRYNQRLYKNYLKKWDYQGLFKNYNPKISAWSYRASLFITPLSILVRLIIGRNKRDKLFKYFDYISRYGNHYHSFGFNIFSKYVHEIRNPFSLYSLSWLCESGLSRYLPEGGPKPLVNDSNK